MQRSALLPEHIRAQETSPVSPYQPPAYPQQQTMTSLPCAQKPKSFSFSIESIIGNTESKQTASEPFHLPPTPESCGNYSEISDDDDEDLDVETVEHDGEIRYSPELRSV